MDPILPPELERDIFEITAVLYPTSILALVLVAHRVLEWVQPFLYRTLMVKTGSRSTSAFLRVRQTQPQNSSFFRNSVHNLFVHHDAWLANEARLILSSCSSITNFVMMTPNPSILPLLEDKHLTHFSTSLAPLFENGRTLQNLVHPIFTHTTHLHLFDPLHTEQDWSALALLPALTHLCLTSFVHRDQILRVLACTRLQVLTNVHINTAPEWPIADICGRLAIDDPRFVLITLDMSINAYGRDWERGRRGKQDFWAVADAFVAKKRLGLIKPASRCWICDLDEIY
ncbi:hypothetical protein DFH06DRAFT_1166971, partial [Mycena polygramma]